MPVLCMLCELTPLLAASAQLLQLLSALILVEPGHLLAAQPWQNVHAEMHVDCCMTIGRDHLLVGLQHICMHWHKTT